MNIAPVLPIGSMERAISLPEVLACIFSWLKDERYTLRCVRLVSKGFLAVANQFFRIHLTSDYAIEHNCIQEAAGIIGGLTLTFPRIIIEEADILSRHLGLEPQDNIVSLGFCSMVAQNCVHLEKVKIVLEGPHSEEISQLLSCLFSQDPENAAVFRIKSLEIVFGVKFAQPLLQNFVNANLPDGCTGHLPTTNYIPTESPLALLEELRLSKRVVVELPTLYRILQLKICPEVAAATSFLGPVFSNQLGSEALHLAASSKILPSRTLKTFSIPDSCCSVNELYALKEQAPELEQVDALTICNTNMSITNEEAFARDSARSPGTLRLKKLNLATTTDQDTNLLLCRLIDLSVFESYVTYYIHGLSGEVPSDDNHGAWFLDPPVPRRILTGGVRIDSSSGRLQEKFFRELGFSSGDSAIEHVDWLQALKGILRLHRLEKLFLPLAVDSFLDMFDTSIPSAAASESATSLDPILTTTTMTISGGEESLDGLPQLLSQPFPACSSLLSFHIGSSDHKNPSERSSQRFADYLIRFLPRLESLELPKCCFTDFIFLNAIAPPVPRTSAPLSLLSPQPPLRKESSPDSGKERKHNHHGNQNNGCDNSSHSSTGLYRLESLEIAFDFLNRFEFRKLPRSERVKELLERRADIETRYPQWNEGQEGYSDIRLIGDALRIEGQKMLLDARPIEVHEERLDQFLTILERFQRQKARSWFIGDELVKIDSAGPNAGAGKDDAVGLKRMTVHQSGMPKVYVEKLKAQVASRFPELDFKISNGYYHIG